MSMPAKATSVPPEPSKKAAWFTSVWAFTLAFLVVGPLALPLLWKNPSLSNRTKWAVSVVAVGVTVLLVKYTWDSLKVLSEL